MQTEALLQCSVCEIYIWPDEEDGTRVWFTNTISETLCPECGHYCEWLEVSGDVETVKMHVAVSRDEDH